MMVDLVVLATDVVLFVVLLVIAKLADIGYQRWCRKNGV